MSKIQLFDYNSLVNDDEIKIECNNDYIIVDGKNNDAELTKLWIANHPKITFSFNYTTYIDDDGWLKIDNQHDPPLLKIKDNFSKPNMDAIDRPIYAFYGNRPIIINGKTLKIEIKL